MIEAQNCDYCGILLGPCYVRWQPVTLSDGREKVVDYQRTRRFCGSDCMVQWVRRVTARIVTNINLEWQELLPPNSDPADK